MMWAIKNKPQKNVYSTQRKMNKNTDNNQQTHVPDLGGSCAIAGGCCCCTDTASGCEPRLHNLPSYGGSLWSDSCKQPPAPPQAELRGVLEYAPWTLNLCKDSNHKPSEMTTNSWRHFIYHPYPGVDILSNLIMTISISILQFIDLQQGEWQPYHWQQCPQLAWYWTT